MRRYIVETYGAEALFRDGLRIETAVEPSIDAAAYENVDFGTRHQDKRQGWRGAEWYLDGKSRELFVELEKVNRERDQLEIEWGQLQLEQSAWSTHAFVENVAATNLGMRTPPPRQIEVVAP